MAGPDRVVSVVSPGGKGAVPFCSARPAGAMSLPACARRLTRSATGSAPVQELSGVP